MNNRTPIRRYVPVRKKRPGPPRRGQPTNEEKEGLRFITYQKYGGLCQLHLHPKCTPGVLPYKGSIFERAHLVHIRSKRRFGWGVENLTLGCFHCHIEAVHIKGVKIPEQAQ